MGIMQRSWHFTCTAILAVGLIGSGGYRVAAQVEPRALELPLAQWSFEAQGNFVGRVDRRELYQIVHPLAAAEAGDYGRIVTRVALPADAKPPYTLRFYYSDNLFCEGHSPNAVVDIRVGHRFAEALVNGAVVWSRDQAANEPLSDPQYTLVDITGQVGAERSFELALQVRQEVDSSSHLPDDRVRHGMYAGTVQEFAALPWEQYGTIGFWGDVAVHWGEPPQAEQLPCEWAPELAVRGNRLPSVPAAVHEQAQVQVENPHLLVGPWVWPVSQGLPLPMGALREVGGLRLETPDGRPVVAGFSEMGRWPDGSLRWVLADFGLPSGAGGRYRLHWGSEVKAHPEAPPNPVVTSDDLRMDNGLAWARWSEGEGGARELIIGRAGGHEVLSAQRPYMVMRDKLFTPRWLEGRWLHRSPHRAEMEMSGELVAEDGDRYGSCRLRLTMFADTPLLRLMYTIINERAEPVPEYVPDQAAVANTQGLVGGTRPLTAVVDAYGIRMALPGAREQSADEGWVSVAGDAGCVTGALRDFAHLWPVGIETTTEGLDFQLFKPGDQRLATYSTYPGEAKTHEIWLALTEQAPTEGDAARLLELAENAPRLDSSGLIRDSYVWGEIPLVGSDHHRTDFALLIEGVLDPYYEGTLEGIRHYGGYSGGLNFYWNGLHSMYMLYAMTGERKWYDRAERSIRHYMDVCTIHWSPDGSNVGGKNRSVDKFLAVYLVHQNPHPLFDHWNLTGDPDGDRLGRANADLIITDEALRAHTEARADRQQGWPLMAMVRAWQETGDERYAQRAREIVDIALGYLEDRRGAYLRHHGINSHLGIVPFMSGILCSGLRHYHLWTGDDRAAEALAQIAESVYAEMHDPAVSRATPDVDYYYSPSPYLRGNDGKTPISHLNHNIASAQAYGAWLTNDPELADIAWRTWRALLRGGEYGSISYLYDVHAALYWLDRAPVPDRTPAMTVGRLWRDAVGALEVWLDRPDGRPFEVKVRWTAHEKPYYPGQTLERWEEYCARVGLRGEVQVLDPAGQVVAAAPMDLTATPRGASVTLQVPAGEPGLHRIVAAGAEQAPVLLVLEDLSEHVRHWGVPTDRTWLSGGREYHFHVLPETRQLTVRCGLLTPWEHLTLALVDPEGRVVRSGRHTGETGLVWEVPVAPELAGRTWCLRRSATLSALVQIEGAAPVVSPGADAAFAPATVPPPRVVDHPIPEQWRDEVVHIPAGGAFRVPRGEPTGELAWEHLNAAQGTIELWLRADTSDASVAGLGFLRCGGLNLTRRTQIGTYWVLGEGHLQSGFLIRPGVWYHLGLVWDYGGGQRPARMNLLVNGVPLVSRMQTRLPDQAVDWTGEALLIGSAEPMSIAGLRIWPVARDEQLQAGVLSPPRDDQMLYCQEAGR